jgi:predicted glycoside hydrolase/deacetylase ChbG (UPF0249 family)
MKRLIVNADDAGADEARNAGIFEAIEAGTVTSISILPNGPALEDAVRRIHALDRGRISFGIHFNLSEGKPLTSGLRLVAGADGCFLGKKSTQRLFTKRGDPKLADEIGRELDAQIAALRNAGVPIDHLDGHQHVHIFPAVVDLAIEKAKAHRIPWIRIPAEPESEFLSGSLSSQQIDEARFFSGYAEAARLRLYSPGILTTDHFRGLYLKGRLPASHWMEFLEKIPEGLTELMVHPGRAAADSASGPFSGFSTLDREMELNALADGRFRQALLKTGVELTPFPEATS